MAGNPRGTHLKINVELRNILLELIVEYLIDQPPDFIQFAIDFLRKKKEQRTVVEVKGSDLKEELISLASEIEVSVAPRNRMQTVFRPGIESPEDLEFVPPVHPKTDLEIQKLKEAIKHIVIFKSLEKEDRDVLLDAMDKRDVAKGETIIEYGDDGDYFYVIESGVFEATLPEGDGQTLLKRYVNTGYFGELALLYDVPRACTVKAVTSGVLWTLDRDTFSKIVVGSAFKKRKLYSDLINKVAILGELTPYEKMSVADALVTRNFRDGEKIIQEGDKADGMYFIERGKVKVTVMDSQGQEALVKFLQSGDYFGELALVTHKPRAASVYAQENVKLAFLDTEAFERLLGPCIEIMKRNFQNYEKQIATIFSSNSLNISGRDSIRTPI